MVIFVTGGSGYVGQSLINLLATNKENQIYAPTRKELDLSDHFALLDYFNKCKIDVVIHLAACLDNNDNDSIFNSNIIALYNLLNVCKKQNVKRFIFASSNNVYGASENRIFDENDQSNPLDGNYYGLSKYCGELLIKDFLRNSGVNYSIVRIADIYGPNQKTGALIKAVVGNILNGLPQKLYGSGDRTRDYIYIQDVIDGIVFILNNNIHGIYNLSTGIGTSVYEIVKIAEKLSGFNYDTINVKVTNEDHTKVVLSNKKLKEAGFVYKTSIEEGLKKVILGGKEND